MRKLISIEEKRAAIKAMEFPYCYYGYIIDPDGDVDHLHFGLWDDDTSGIKQAQNNLSELFLGNIPLGVRNILDVGCGLGTTAHLLSKKGFRVVGISPDDKIMNIARSRYSESDNMILLKTSYESFNSHNEFDLLLFQESSQYLDIEYLFSKAKTLLKRNGYVLMCDEVRYTGNKLPYGHFRDAIINAAEKHGFSLSKNGDISEGVLETRRFGSENLRSRYSEIVRAFTGIRENVEKELETLERNWVEHNKEYDAQKSGYEWFLFKMKSG